MLGKKKYVVKRKNVYIGKIVTSRVREVHLIDDKGNLLLPSVEDPIIVETVNIGSLLKQKKFPYKLTKEDLLAIKEQLIDNPKWIEDNCYLFGVNPVCVGPESNEKVLTYEPGSAAHSVKIYQMLSKSQIPYIHAGKQR